MHEICFFFNIKYLMPIINIFGNIPNTFGICFCTTIKILSQIEFVKNMSLLTIKYLITIINSFWAYS